MSRMTFNINGKTFDNMEEMSREMFNDASTNPECDTLVWAYQDYVGCAFVGGRMIYPDGTHDKGKCAIGVKYTREPSNTKAISSMLVASS